ncbi:Tetraacyldisaccharide 4'-kinase [Tenacibaculum litopenaei]|uniref:tetraacyldisaccharide 4'-kinase n=1 Tax=Tenacibaculum litopenaei TaxID=396016 RepID=UPI003892F936
MKLLRYLLFPLSLVYRGITSLRNAFFDWGLFPQRSFQIPVIAVGNLSVGGTGKSPQVEYLIRLLKDRFQLATLSRGYKRSTKGYQLVTASHTAGEVGDEPKQFFRKFGTEIQVAVDADRVAGIETLLQGTPIPELVVLDDAFQHRKVKASLYILLTKYDDLYSRDYVLPTGNLRESRAGARRAALVVVTKCPNNLSNSERERIEKSLQLAAGQRLFFSRIKYDEQLRGAQVIHIGDLKKKKVVLVTGIANPTPLLTYLESQQVLFEHLSYPDHYNFNESDLKGIQERFERTEDAVCILTTEKDFVRLEGKLPSLQYLAIESEFIEGGEAFDQAITEHIDAFYAKKTS